MADLYFDNLHKQLYAYDGSTETTNVGTGDQMTFGLADLGELPGQSTWHIRSIRFKCQGFNTTGGSAPMSTVEVCGGVCSRDIVGQGIFSNPKSYQDYAGFPLKGVYSELFTENTPQGNRFSFTKTYTPSKHLTLNREQNLVWAIKLINGNEAFSRLSIYVHAERGD